MYYPEPPPLHLPQLKVTSPSNNNYSVPPPSACFSPQPTRDAYQMEPDEETAAVLNQVGVHLFICCFYCSELWVIILAERKEKFCCRTYTLVAGTELKMTWVG